MGNLSSENRPTLGYFGHDGREGGSGHSSRVDMYRSGKVFHGSYLTYIYR